MSRSTLPRCKHGKALRDHGGDLLEPPCGCRLCTCGPTLQALGLHTRRCPAGDVRMKIYVASSWRNLLQPDIVRALRRCGHEVYDFRHPAPGVEGFSWSEIDPAWRDWTPAAYRAGLQHPVARQGYHYDITALRECDTCVLVLPSGRSASWEFGYAMGAGKRGFVVIFEPCEPELMYREAIVLTSMDELIEAFVEP